MLTTIIENTLKMNQICNLRRLRVLNLTNCEYCTFSKHNNITELKIAFDIDCIRKILLLEDHKEHKHFQDQSILCFRRHFPEHFDLFLFDVSHGYFKSLLPTERSSLIHHLTRCIDLSYVLSPNIISIKCSSRIISTRQPMKPNCHLDLYNLSDKEYAYLELLSAPGSSKELGYLFNKSPRTLEKMVANLCKKLQIFSKLQLQLFAKFLTSYNDTPYSYYRIPSTGSIKNTNQNSLIEIMNYKSTNICG